MVTQGREKSCSICGLRGRFSICANSMEYHAGRPEAWPILESSTTPLRDISDLYLAASEMAAYYESLARDLHHLREERLSSFMEERKAQER